MTGEPQGPYSQAIRDHYTHPRNAGTIENPSGKAIARSPVDSDIVLITLHIEDGRIQDIKFKCMGAESLLLVHRSRQRWSLARLWKKLTNLQSKTSPTRWAASPIQDDL